MANNTESFLDTCLIRDLVDNTHLRFQFMPEDLSESAGAQWDDSLISGRPYPIKGYASSEATGITVNLTFFDDPGPLPSKVDINKIIWWIRSLKCPDYSQGWVAPPHPVFFQLGKFLRMYAVVTNVAINFKAPWDFLNERPRMIETQISLAEIGDNPYGSDVNHVRAQAGLMGLRDVEISRYVNPAPSSSGVPSVAVLPDTSFLPWWNL